MTTYIPVGNTVALIDDEDLPIVAGNKWHLSDQGYAVRQVGRVGQRMHRIILGVTDPSLYIDHINGNKLDNRKENLRICTKSQNQWNSHKIKATGGRPSSSQYKGVSWFARGSKWLARITVQGKKIHLGYFEKEEDAACAYDARAIELFGEFARTNFRQQ